MDIVAPDPLTAFFHHTCLFRSARLHLCHRGGNRRLLPDAVAGSQWPAPAEEQADVSDSRTRIETTRVVYLPEVASEEKGKEFISSRMAGAHRP